MSSAPFAIGGDGNKRTALVVALVFLEMNGHALKLGFVWAEHIERLAAGELSRDELVALFAAEMGDAVATRSVVERARRTAQD